MYRIFLRGTKMECMGIKRKYIGVRKFVRREVDRYMEVVTGKVDG